MTNTDKEPLSTPESLPVMTESAPTTDSPAILTALNAEEEVELNPSTQDLSQVITALQETQIKQDTQELESSLMNPDSTMATVSPPADLTAQSEPDSPRPKPASLIFEKIKTAIDVPEGQNMADFVTPPTPGVAPPSFLSSDQEEEEETLTEIAQVSEPAPAITTDNGAAIDDTDLAVATAAAAAAGAAVNTEGKAAAPVKSNSNTISVFNIDFDNVRPNFLSPRAQEKYGKNYNGKGREKLLIFDSLLIR